MYQLHIVIPAVKKSVAFPDDLIKKLDGRTLIQRAIDTAKALEGNTTLYLLTDSEEISLIAERNKVQAIYDSEFLRDADYTRVQNALSRLAQEHPNDHFLLLWPYMPLVNSNLLTSAYKEFLQDSSSSLLSIRQRYVLMSNQKDDWALKHWFQSHEQASYVCRAFIFSDANHVLFPFKSESRPYLIPRQEAIEIQTHHDWWICEKLLQQERIVFHVIGYPEVGMGHIYRALSIAHEISDHEIIFVCTKQSELAIQTIASKDYDVMVFEEDDWVQGVINLKPRLLINDCLNTNADDIQDIKENGISVLNFEDLGSGASHSDVTINELYDSPVLDSKNICWGHDYLFLRDEFLSATPRPFSESVTSILISFGGTDAKNLSLTALKSIVDIARTYDINVHIVTGKGYQHKAELEAYIQGIDLPIRYTNQTAVMSKIMEGVDLAIISNGRTPYEIAHMNIPAIVIAQHERENTHSFATEENGFVYMGQWDAEKSADALTRNVEMLVSDPEHRRRLYKAMRSLDFLKNKHKVLEIIQELLQ